MSNKAIVALVGRPNVGKSTLFNRIIGRRLAVVSDVAGTTRDRLYSDAEWGGSIFTVIDTGGIEVTEGRHTEPLSEDSERFLPLIRQQATVAMQDADVIVLVVDGQTGITAADREVANILRQADKPVIIAANKLESSKLWDTAYEFYELGLGEVVAVSALHGTGTGDLLDVIVGAIPPSAVTEEAEDESIKIAILGRPNVGKSTLLNKLIGKERAIVSPIAGTTRDAIDEKLRWHGQEFTIIDTAGIRRRGKIDPGIEKYSVLRAIKTLRRADVALLLIDGVEEVTSQDAHIAGMLVEENAGVIILVNKWDLIGKDQTTAKQFEEEIRRKTAPFTDYPVLFISAITKQRIHKVLELIMSVYENRSRKITTSKLNEVMLNIIGETPPPSTKGKHIRIKYVTQLPAEYPAFAFFCNLPQYIRDPYKRFVENRLRENFQLTGAPVRIYFRKK